LVSQGLKPSDVVIVTDIGCSGLSDRYLLTHSVHGLHGRSLTYATGIKLARPELTVIVLIGDGGCGIGAGHLLAAARRNIGITVIVFNNLNFGMTGGQSSTTTPLGAYTSTARQGHLEHPLDLVGTVAINGAAFAARSTTFDNNLGSLLAEAIKTKGFALVDIWELCTAYFVPRNRFSKNALLTTMSELGFATGIVHRQEKPEFAQVLHTKVQGDAAALRPNPLPQRYQAYLSAPQHLVLAGSAGGKVRSAAMAFGRGSVLSGLWASQRDDYPVTVMSGHSVSEISISPQEVYTSITHPDRLIILSADGLRASSRYLNRMDSTGVVYMNRALGAVQTQARVIPIDFDAMKVRKEGMGFAALGFLLGREQPYPFAAFADAIAMGGTPKVVAENTAAAQIGYASGVSSGP